MIKTLLILCTCTYLISCNQKSSDKTNNAESIASYNLPIPMGWSTEIFTLPAKFAPSITYKGVEDIRFTPGWAKAGSNEYWTYAFLWNLDDSISINENIIAANLKAYFTGLIATNLDKSKLPGSKITETETVIEKIETHKGDKQTFQGTIRMLDYMNQQQITLNCKVHLIHCEGQNNTYLFHEFSPKPFTDNVWKGLQLVRTGFECVSPLPEKLK